MTEYHQFIEYKSHYGGDDGFAPTFLPDCLKDFQRALVEWSCRRGRAAVFADCGLGKTLIQLVWAENVVRKTNGRVLILTPLAVGAQTVREGEKFGIEAHRSKAGELNGKIVVANYERLHHFNPSDFIGCVCDESSILKNYEGRYKGEITGFMRKMPYRLLCTATAAPNDYIELGTSSEALGELGFMDMLTRFFKNDQNPTVDTRRRYHGDVPKWRFKHHAEGPFWRYVCSWARAIRKPSDLLFPDDGFILPELHEVDHMVEVEKPRNGMLFNLPAVGLHEQCQERRSSIEERCEMAANLSSGHDSSILWCHLNDEGNLLEKITPDSVQVCGHQTDDEKEERLMSFLSGQVNRLITKPMMAGFGLNLQRCAHMTFFPSHSYEQYYQSVRRCWRFGQKREVTVDIISTHGDEQVIRNLKRKEEAADAMFSRLVEHMNNSIRLDRSNQFTKKMEAPAWLLKIS